MNRSCRRLPRHSTAKTGEPAGEADFANRPRAFTGLAPSQFKESPDAKFGAHWDHEPKEQTSARQRLGERQSSAALGPARRIESARGLAQSKTWRFMESLPDFSIAHWDHEPARERIPRKFRAGHKFRGAIRGCPEFVGRFMEREPSDFRPQDSVFRRLIRVDAFAKRMLD